MIRVKAPNTIEEITYGQEGANVKVFLAGCANTDWRNDFVKKFDNYRVTFLDPKRDDWDLMNDNDTVNQITWEYNYLKEADVICYGFNGGSVCPITLLEYGMWGLTSKKPIMVYASDDYEKRRDIIFQTMLARPEIPVLRTFEDFIGRTQLTVLGYGKQRRD